MKTTIAKQMIWVATAALFLSPSAFAKKKPGNLSSFAGSYTGTVTFTAPGESTSGTANVVISAAKNGRSATISYAATLQISGDSVVFPTVITLAQDKSDSVTDLGVGIAGTNNAHRGNGNYSVGKKTLSIFATNGDMNLNVSGNVKDKKKKRKLGLTLVSSDGTATYVFTTTLTAKVPKAHK